MLIAQLDTVRVVDIHRMGVGASSNLGRRELFMLLIFSYSRRYLLARKKPRIPRLHLFVCVGLCLCYYCCEFWPVPVTLL